MSELTDAAALEALRQAPGWRFAKTYDHQDKDKGYTCTYQIAAPDGQAALVADVFKHCAVDPTLVRSATDGAVAFSIRPKRKFLNTDYAVRQGEDGAVIGALQQASPVGMRNRFWSILDGDGREIGAVCDPAPWLEQFAKQNLGGARKSYLFTSEMQPIALLCEVARPRAVQGGKLRQWAARLMPHLDWVLHIDEERAPLPDRRLLLSAALLVQALNVMFDKSN